MFNNTLTLSTALQNISIPPQAKQNNNSANITHHPSFTDNGRSVDHFTGNISRTPRFQKGRSSAPKVLADYHIRSDKSQTKAWRRDKGKSSGLARDKPQIRQAEAAGHRMRVSRSGNITIETRRRHNNDVPPERKRGGRNSKIGIKNLQEENLVLKPRKKSGSYQPIEPAAHFPTKRQAPSLSLDDKRPQPDSFRQRRQTGNDKDKIDRKAIQDTLTIKITNENFNTIGNDCNGNYLLTESIDASGHKTFCNTADNPFTGSLTSAPDGQGRLVKIMNLTEPLFDGISESRIVAWFSGIKMGNIHERENQVRGAVARTILSNNQVNVTFEGGTVTGNPSIYDSGMMAGELRGSGNHLTQTGAGNEPQTIVAGGCGGGMVGLAKDSSQNTLISTDGCFRFTGNSRLIGGNLGCASNLT